MNQGSVPNAQSAPSPSAPGPAVPAAYAHAFSWRVRVYYEDTDAGGVVYYANYLRFFERCRTEWMRALGFGQTELVMHHGVLFVVAAADIRYIRPARLDDELIIEARIVERYSCYVVFEQKALRGSELLSRVRVKVACVDARTLRPVRLPAALVDLLPEIEPPPLPSTIK
jgi:acyl-CoA thioester hydrolase